MRIKLFCVCLKHLNKSWFANIKEDILDYVPELISKSIKQTAVRRSRETNRSKLYCKRCPGTLKQQQIPKISEINSDKYLKIDAQCVSGCIYLLLFVSNSRKLSWKQEKQIGMDNFLVIKRNLSGIYDYFSLLLRNAGHM